MKVSILDQSPVSSGMSERDALLTSIRLAQHAEKLGYERFWIAEHHDLFGLACSNPSVMLSAIGAQTNTIKIGAGAVLLPYYQPFHVAETYNLLATLYPGRIDLGLGRAPGGSAEVSLALSDNYLAEVRKFPEKIDDLLRFFRSDFPEDHPYSKISPTPIPEVEPAVWLLGTSEKSATLAAEKGLHYAFGDFMTDQDGPAIVQRYRKGMLERHPNKDPYVIVAINVICAPTTEEAEALARSQWLWKIRQEAFGEETHIPSVEEAKHYKVSAAEQEKIEQMKRQMIVGNPDEVRTGLLDLHEQYQADEYMIVTVVHEEAAKLRSYELVKEIAVDLD